MKQSRLIETKWGRYYYIKVDYKTRQLSYYKMLGIYRRMQQLLQIAPMLFQNQTVHLKKICKKRLY